MLAITKNLGISFLFIGNAPGLEIIFPMSVVAICGIVTGLLFNLFALPGLYLRFGQVSETMMEEEKSMIELDVKESVHA